MRECWPFNADYGYRIRNKCIPSDYLKYPLTILQLLAQADMVRMAAYSFNSRRPGILVHRKDWDESLRSHWIDNLLWIHPYTKPHTFHELQNPEGDLT